MMMRKALAVRSVVKTCQCFERRQLSAFPIALSVVNRNPAKHLFVHVFCVCQLPESYDSNMIQPTVTNVVCGTILSA